MNFDPDRFSVFINDVISARDVLRGQVESKVAGLKVPSGPADYKLPAGQEYNLDVLEAEGKRFLL